MILAIKKVLLDNDPMTKQPKTVSARLRRAIETAGVTRYRLAKLSGVPESTLCKFMGGAGLNIDNVDLLCAALKLELRSTERKGN